MAVECRRKRALARPPPGAAETAEAALRSVYGESDSCQSKAWRGGGLGQDVARRAQPCPDRAVMDLGSDVPPPNGRRADSPSHVSRAAPVGGAPTPLPGGGNFTQHDTTT